MVSDHRQVDRHRGLSIFRLNSKETPRTIRATSTTSRAR